MWIIYVNVNRDVLCCPVLCCVVLCCVVLCCVVLCCIVLYCDVLCYDVMYCDEMYCVVLCCVVLCCVVLCCVDIGTSLFKNRQLMIYFSLLFFLSIIAICLLRIINLVIYDYFTSFYLIFNHLYLIQYITFLF